jgi:hypothetical protein
LGLVTITFTDSWFYSILPIGDNMDLATALILVYVGIGILIALLYLFINRNAKYNFRATRMIVCFMVVVLWPIFVIFDGLSALGRIGRR